MSDKNLYDQSLVVRYGVDKGRLARWKLFHEKVAWLEFRASQTNNDIKRHKLLENAANQLKSANKILREASRNLCESDPNKNKT
ncbi:MAG TPA: hypothetical protein EYF95_08315 [Flavobacteriales bacterium]|nr:hypothetical protein [Flavobacteriales bacterium]